MIKITDLKVIYDNDFVSLDSISFNIDEGECVGLIGPNGAGKSTLFRSLTGLIDHEGTILVDGVEVTSKNLSEIRKKIGYVIQESDDQMFMPTVIEDMIFGPVNYGGNKDDVIKEADKILAKLKISHLKEKYNHKLSGGEKKMASIATILMMKPDIILFDEPTSSLDPSNRRLVMNTIKEVKGTKIIASHDLDLVYDICDKVILMNKGKVIKVGGKDEILRDKTLLESNDLELPLSFSSHNI
ncbi:MAG: ABC transporter ATP-binding protein [Clostridiales bacterium]|nr:ABC transporter ATP-binding protein [Clostridiales bacterium]